MSETYIMKTAALHFLKSTELEVGRARAKFPSSQCAMVALMEEVGELAQALLKQAAGKGSMEEVYNEAVQVAAMACRVATEGDPSITNYNEP